MIQKSNTQKAFISNLTRLMESRGWSQSKLAKQVGCTQPAISQILRGKRFPSSIIIEGISKALEVPVSRLFEEKNET